MAAFFYALCERHHFQDRLAGRVSPYSMFLAAFVSSFSVSPQTLAIKHCLLRPVIGFYMPALRELLTRILRWHKDKDASIPMLFVAELAR